jgi:DNA-binding IscR family transcriptional regulator
LPKADSAVQKDSVFTAIWAEVEGAMARVLDKVTFEDIINKAKGREEAIIYQI